jgi:hypothetical protein
MGSVCGVGRKLFFPHLSDWSDVDMQRLEVVLPVLQTTFVTALASRVHSHTHADIYPFLAAMKTGSSTSHTYVPYSAFFCKFELRLTFLPTCRAERTRSDWSNTRLPSSKSRAVLGTSKSTPPKPSCEHHHPHYFAEPLQSDFRLFLPTQHRLYCRTIFDLVVYYHHFANAQRSVFSLLS